MSETKSETAVQKDENGIDIINGRFDSFFFVDTTKNFFARFRRLVNVNETLYAEVDHGMASNDPDRKIRYVRLIEFTALKKCKPGDDLHCRWLLRKPVVLAHQTCSRGRRLSEKEWREISSAPGALAPPNYPLMYSRLVEA